MKPLYLSLVITALPVTQQFVDTQYTPFTAPVTLKVMPYVNMNITSQKQKDSSDMARLKESDWYTGAVKTLQQEEYAFARQEDNTWSTPNRNNNLRFYYSGNGFTVQPRTTEIPIGNEDGAKTPREFMYKKAPDWKIAFNLDKKQIGQGVWKVEGNRAEYITDRVTVQYTNSEAGMRQNFVLPSPLSAGDAVQINFTITTGLQVQLRNNALRFLHHKAGVVLTYDHLKVWDATGRPLKACFQKNNDHYSIHVQAKNAVYPITIDPLSSTPATMLQGNQANANFGVTAASAGDVNGDGYSDVIIGANQYDNGQTNEGAAFIYHGGTNGVGTTYAARLESNQANAYLGISVSGAGDINGDGYSDVIAGAYRYDNGEADEGRAFVFYGSTTGINTTPTTLEINYAAACFGRSVACAGDVNGDGFSDVIVGANQYGNGQFYEGAAFVYHGSANGIGTTAAAVRETNQAYAWGCSAVASAGDINGDGYSDVLAGAFQYDNGETDEGIVLIYYGSSTGIGTAGTLLQSNQERAFFGYSVASAGDVNGDGYSDVIVGSLEYDNGEANEGAVFIYHGSATGLNTNASLRMECNEADAYFGGSAACAGDINGDGYSDIIVGAYGYDGGITNQGAAFVYTGSVSGVNAIEANRYQSNQVSACMGTAVGSAGDVNGDGYSDVIVGAVYYDNGQSNEGAAFLYHGAASGIGTAAAIRLEGNQLVSFYGYSVAGAGDVNGDGFSDVIVGAMQYDNGHTNEGAAFIYHGTAYGLSTVAGIRLEGNQNAAGFGSCVAAAGDVNGDGYGDVIIGANRYSNGQNTEGVAFVYHGSASGINATAAVRLEANQADANFGLSVACAGDVNGDGYSDVVVGAYTFDQTALSNAGAVFVYHGSATGINATAATTIAGTVANGSFGRSVAGAGDVNGDGFSDIIAGAPFQSGDEWNEGKAYVYHGSATGIGTTAASVVESNRVYALLGTSVTGAGDVNGDGYADVAVGADFYGNGETDEGAVFVYYGSAGGIGTAAAAIVESNEASARFGISVANAGDVNGDGYSDIIVGANGINNEGRAFIYHGAATGLNTVAATVVAGNPQTENFGLSVAGLGDVNGDGYSDVMAGAYTYTNELAQEGAAYVFYGNSTATGKRNYADVYNTNLTTPVNITNLPDATFGAGLFARSFLGRAKGKLVWETRVSYANYSGSPVTNSVSFTSAQTSYTNMGTTGTMLKNAVVKVISGRYTKVRVRIKYDPVTAITGQLYSPWRYVPEVVSTGSLGVLPVQFISYKAEWLQAGKTAVVKFTTDNESELCCYEIEKSSDGISFGSIGRLPAKNSGGRQAYNFTDEHAAGKKIYYRVNAIFYNGNTEHSGILSLQTGAAGEARVFPNPATSVLQLQLSDSHEKISVQIVNTAGQVVKRIDNISAAGETIEIPLDHIKPGVYFLNLQSGDARQVFRFVKQ